MDGIGVLEMLAKRMMFSAAYVACFLWAGLLGGTAIAGNFMAAGELTSQPIGHYEFCKRQPLECSVRLRDRGPMAMTDEWRGMVEYVNLTVNREIHPMNDIDIYGVEEYWAYPDNGVADCEDFVLEKRRRLHAAGIPLSNLLITVVRKTDGEGHAVLTLRTTEGDLVLDNLIDEVKLWSWTSYDYLKRQASTHTGRWVSLRDSNNLLVGAVSK